MGPQRRHRSAHRYGSHAAAARQCASRPTGKGLAIVAKSGDPGAMAADRTTDLGIEPAALASATTAPLDRTLASAWSWQARRYFRQCRRRWRPGRSPPLPPTPAWMAGDSDATGHDAADRGRSRGRVGRGAVRHESGRKAWRVHGHRRRRPAARRGRPPADDRPLADASGTPTQGGGSRGARRQSPPALTEPSVWASWPRAMRPRLPSGK